MFPQNAQIRLKRALEHVHIFVFKVALGEHFEGLLTNDHLFTETEQVVGKLAGSRGF